VLAAVLALAVAGAEVGTRLSGPDPAPAVPAGMLRPLPGPPWAGWRAPAERTDDVLAATGVLAVAAVRDRRFEVSAYDAASGDARWTRDLGPVGAAEPLTGCPHDGTDVGGLVLCVVEPPPWPRQPGERRRTVPFPAPDDRSATVVAVAATTGEVRGTWTLAGRVAGVERVADDLVVLLLGQDGRARVTRRDGVTGAVRWAYRTAEPVRLREGIVSGAELAATEQFVLVQGWAVTVLDAEDGAVLAAPPRASFVAGSLGPGLFGTWASDAGATVRDRRGRVLFGARALPPPLAATDGRPGDTLVLDEGATVVGRALPDGDVLWRLDTTRAPRLQAGGRVLLLGTDGFQVLDARSGAQLWEVSARTLMWWSPVTDGRSVLSPGRGPDGAPTVEARDLADGTLRWTLPLVEGTRSVAAVGGHLVLRTADEVVVLR
jgi:outer membrane protein assembly factor BamB